MTRDNFIQKEKKREIAVLPISVNEKSGGYDCGWRLTHCNPSRQRFTCVVTESFEFPQQIRAYRVSVGFRWSCWLPDRGLTTRVEHTTVVSGNKKNQVGGALPFPNKSTRYHPTTVHARRHVYDERIIETHRGRKNGRSHKNPPPPRLLVGKTVDRSPTRFSI